MKESSPNLFLDGEGISYWETSSNLRTGQIEAVRETFYHLNNGVRSGYIHHPTGYGKTRVMSEIGKLIGGTQTIFTPSIELAFQTENARREDEPDADIGIIGGGKKEFGHRITVITPNSFMSLCKMAEYDSEALERLQALLASGVVFVDEVHRFLTSRRLEMFSRFQNAIRIGATATDKYSEQKKAEGKFGIKFHEVSFERGMEEGVLVRARGFLVKSGLSLAGIKSQNTSLGSDFVRSDLSKRINIEYRDNLAFDALEKAFGADNNRPVISFCVDRLHARDHVRRARARGLRAEFITGEMKVSERNEIWERQKRGEIQVVATVDTANEGIDKPWVEVGMMLRPTRSEVLARQRFGRLLRPSPATGKHCAYVFEILDDGAQDIRNRPITVFDLFDTRRIRSGDYLVKPSLRNGENKKAIAEGRDKLDGVEISAEVQELPIFGGILGKAGLLGKELLGEEDRGLVIDEIRKAIELRGITGQIAKMSINEYNGLILPFGSNQEPISFRRLVHALNGDPSKTVESYTKALALIFGNEIKGLPDSFKEKKTDRPMIALDFKQILDRRRLRLASAEDMRKIGNVLLGAFQETGLDRQVSVIALGGLRIQTPEFTGSLYTFVRELGIVNGDKRTGINRIQAEALIDIVNNWGGGDYVLPGNSSNGDVREEKVGAHAFSKEELSAAFRDIFEKAKRDGIRFTSYELGGYQIDSHFFKGTFATLVKHALGVKEKFLLKREHVDALLKIAYPRNSEPVMLTEDEDHFL